MARKEPLELPYEDEELLMLMRRLAKQLFVIRVDERDKCKRIFFTEADADRWFAARDSEEGLTPEIQELEFANTDGNGTIPGTEQYKMSLAVAGGTYEYGKRIVLEFTCNTVDTLNDNEPTKEDITVHFQFSNEATGEKTFSQQFNYDVNTRGTYTIDITEYLDPGDNTVTLNVTGKTNRIKTNGIVRFSLINLLVGSNFRITETHTRGSSLRVGYTSATNGERSIEFYIDGTMVKKVDEIAAINEYKYVDLPPINTLGVHSLQIRAVMGNYVSRTLYYEFVTIPAVTDTETLSLVTSLVQTATDDGSIIPMGEHPGLRGEQYMPYELNWAYYSSDGTSEVVTWKATIDGKESTIGSREIDDVEATEGVMPDPVKFIPDQGNATYVLSAYIEGKTDPIGEYTILVLPNSLGLKEADETSGLEMKLSALGRSNGEPAYVREQWTDHGFTTTFRNMDWSSLSGYTGEAVRFEGGATAVISNKPFATEKGTVVKAGMAMSFDFATRNVEDDTIPLIEIGNPDAPNTAYFAIYGNKVVLRSSIDEPMTYSFAEDERTHLAIIVYPNHDSSDKNLMFFALNGVQAPGRQYSSSAVFNIGTIADKADTNGMIRIGDASGKAGIDVYGIRVYTNTIGMFDLMNNCMIDLGGDVLSEYKKNNIFVNQSVDSPNIQLIRDNFRTIEVIGNLGKLETVDSETSFTGSIIYTDPHNPEFNFERKDGNVLFETAGQSRLSDQMAKSFHVDLNPDGHEEVVTYQNGRLTHKNRVIFAEGNTHENKVRVDLCGADSSISRNAAHFKLVNRVYRSLTFDDRPDLVAKYGEYPLRTPAMQYAYGGQYAKDMVAQHGGNETDWIFPNNINVAPDSVPVVIIWHETENAPMQVYGIGCMTEEKKASYANGNQSIYLKLKADGTPDPYDRFDGKSGERGWDNEGTVEMEYIRGDKFSYSSSVAGWNSTTREQTFECCFPKKSDFNKHPELKEQTWGTFFNTFVKPLADTYHNQEAFDREIEDIIWLPSFAEYYNKVMDKKCGDSLCRNMHVLYGCFVLNGQPKWLWYAKWWDVDVQSGLSLTGEPDMPVDADRNSRKPDGTYYLSGRDQDGGSMWLWDGLENNAVFRDLCNAMSKASYNAGWTCDADKEAQDAIVNSFSMGLYNLDGLQKYLQAWRKGHDYMVRYQGAATPFRHGFLDKTYQMREALLGIGDYARRSMSCMIIGAKYPEEVRITAASKMWFGIGLTTTPYVMGIEKSREDGEFAIQLPENAGTLGKDPLHIYGADEILELDMSDFMLHLSSTVNISELAKCQRLVVGCKRDDMRGNFARDTSVAFAGLRNLTRLRELNVGCMLGITKIDDLDRLVFLERLYAAGTSLRVFAPASGAKFNVLELPDTITDITCEKVALGALEFYRTIDTDTEHRCELMTECPTSLLSLTLTGMGDDEGSHRLVHLWLTMLRNNPSLLNAASITYRNIHWEGITKEDLFTLIRIPEAQRKVTGYVFCDSEYTEDEMKQLSAESVFGPKCFSRGSESQTLVCDCMSTSGMRMSATAAKGTPDANVTITDENIQVLQGSDIVLTAVGFPLAGNVSYTYQVYVNNRWSNVIAERPVVNFGSRQQHSLNAYTGEIFIDETEEPTTDFRIRANRSDGATGEVTIRSIARTYPTKAQLSLALADFEVTYLNGVYNITEPGHYIFNADHTPAGYNGRFDTSTEDGWWEVVGVDDSVVARCTTDYLSGRTKWDEFCLQVKRLPEGETPLTLKYHSKWKNVSITATKAQAKIMLVSIVSQVLTRGGNQALFDAFDGTYPHDDGDFSYSSLDLKTVEGTLNMAALLRAKGIDPKEFVTFMSNGRNVLDFLVNVSALDVSETGINDISGDPIDASKLTQLRSLNAEDTYASIKL